ncbi:plasmid replication protein, partial [Pediococcus pentosaceus]|nr:plasmid replication protein [Pediococcus pentosaceus]
MKGHSERNLSQINAFVVDIDFKDALDRDRNLNLVNSSIVLDDHILPTLALKTDKGYQIYYILDRPA